jgi:hypothetical protein
LKFDYGSKLVGEVAVELQREFFLKKIFQIEIQDHQSMFNQQKETLLEPEGNAYGFASYDTDVSESQLSTHIDMMKCYSVLGDNSTIVHCPKNKGYHYTDPNYSTEKLPLSAAEFQTLADALSLLKFTKHGDGSLSVYSV